MRADNDHTLGNSVDICKDDSKPHLCPEEEDAELKTTENGKKNNNNVCELFYDTRSGDDWDKDSVGNISKGHFCGDTDEAGKKIRDTTTSHDCASANGVLPPEKVDPVFYMDKNVTACDLPEVVVCYKENTYHVVKDICVDEGMPVQEKFLFGEMDSVKSTSEDMMQVEKTNVNTSETKSSEEDSNSKTDEDSEFCNEYKRDRDVEEFSKEAFGDAEGSSNHNQELLIVNEEVKDSPEICLETEHDENSKEEVALSLENDIKETLTLGDILSREDEQKSLNKDIISNRPEEQSLSQLQEDKEQRSIDTTALETEFEKTEEPKKAEEKEKISSVSTTTTQEPNKTCNDLEKPEAENHYHQQENSYEDGKHPLSEFGETSFSAADSVSISGHITYSGPIAFSGSLSVRSDASTTSGRSFAFPILQSEWNSSPVRMAKADKKRQKGGWRHTLLCCRFS